MLYITKSLINGTWTKLQREFDVFESTLFSELRKAAITLEESDHHYTAKEYNQAITGYTEVLKSRCNCNDFASCEALLKRSLARIQYAQVLKSLPAIQSETAAIFAPDPEHMLMEAAKDAEKCKEMLQLAIAKVLEIQAQSYCTLGDEVQASQCLEESSSFKKGSVKKERARISNDPVVNTDRKRKPITRDDDLDCILCMKLIYEPVTVPCGHTFCKSCLLRAADHNSSCPVCRRVLHIGRDIPVNIVLATVLERYFPEEYDSRRIEESAKLPSDEGSGGMIPLFVMSPLLVGETMALNIFEPRYRLMIRRVMEGNRRFGMATVDENHQLSDVACEAIIAECESLPDGRFAIEIVGKKRFRPLNAGELDGYRTAEPEYISDDPIELDSEDARKLDILAGKVEELTSEWLEKLRRMAGSRVQSEHFLRGIDRNPGIQDKEKFSFWVSTTILPVIHGKRIKMQLLKTTSTLERLELLKDILSQLKDVQMHGCSIM